MKLGCRPNERKGESTQPPSRSSATATPTLTRLQVRPPLDGVVAVHGVPDGHEVKVLLQQQQAVRGGE